MARERAHADTERVKLAEVITRYAKSHDVVLQLNEDTFDCALLEELAAREPLIEERDLEQTDIYDFCVSYAELFPDSTQLAQATRALRDAGFVPSRKRKACVAGEVAPEERAMAAIIAQNMENTGALGRLAEALSEAAALIEDIDDIACRAQALVDEYGTDFGASQDLA